MLSCGIAALYPVAEGRSTLSFLRSAENRPPFSERQRPSAEPSAPHDPLHGHKTPRQVTEKDKKQIKTNEGSARRAEF